MTRVMAFGVFDILHLGHLYYLNQAKNLGDELIVAVASDSSVRSKMSEPIIPEQLRVMIVDSLKPVDQAVLNNGQDIFKNIEEFKPDIIALGYDQKYYAVKIKKELAKRGLKIKVKRLRRHPNHLLGSSELIHKIVSREGS